MKGIIVAVAGAGRPTRQELGLDEHGALTTWPPRPRAPGANAEQAGGNL